MIMIIFVQLNRVQFCTVTQDAVEFFISCLSISLFPHKFVQVRGQFFGTSPHGFDFQAVLGGRVDETAISF